MMRTPLMVGQVRSCRTFNSSTSESMVEIVESFAHSNGKRNRIFNFQYLSCFFISLIFSVSLLNFWTVTLANPVFVENSHFGHFQSGRNIRNLPCIVRKSGRSGVCMFAIDCIKKNGTHLGTCIDRFYFGSCCQLKDETLFTPEITDNSIDQHIIENLVHESTTIRSSSIFNPISDSHPTVTANNTNKFIQNEIHNQSTTRIPTVQASSTRSPPSRRPSIHTTTYKSSHFVIRTTSTPHSNKYKPHQSETTTKPLKRKTTTTAKPVLTTVQQELEQRIETTTMPSKIFTFQIVETTNPSITEPTSADEQQKQPQILQPKPSSPSSTPNDEIGENYSSSKIIQTTVPPATTTNKTKTRPSSTKRPSATKTTTQSAVVSKAPVTKAPMKKPTNKPSKINITEAIESIISKLTDKPPPLKPLIALNQNQNLTATENVIMEKPIYKPYRTTPTPATKMPTSNPLQKITTTTPKITITTTNTIATNHKPPPTKISAKITTTTTTTTSTTTTTTTTISPPRTTPAEATTARSTTTTSTTFAPSTTTLASTSTVSTSTTPKLILNSTSEAFVETETIKEQHPSTTPSKLGLVTWSNIDTEPVTSSSSEMDWEPRPPADWIIVSTIAPESTSKSSHETTTEKVNNFITEEPIALNSTRSTTSEYPVTSSTTNPPSSEMSNTTAFPTTTDAILEQESTTSEFIDFTTINPIMGERNETLSTTPMISSFEEVNYKQICGRRMFPEPRIVGGANSAFARWPWQVSLRQWRTSTYLHKCGAALLNENWAITAAHCVDNVPPSDLLLRLGEYDLAEEEEPYGYQERRVQIVASHPQFDPRTFEYDLALLRFYEPVIFQPNIIPVCVPESDYDFIGQTAFVTGWGRLYEDGPLPSVLQEVAVPVINNTICESMYRAAGYIEHIPHIFICAGWKKGGYDSCEGDSGGPMVLQREEDKRFVLGGVISWGIGCAEANQPGVYTRISEFRDWINQILQF